MIFSTNSLGHFSYRGREEDPLQVHVIKSSTVEKNNFWAFLHFFEVSDHCGEEEEQFFILANDILNYNFISLLVLLGMV